MGGRRHDAGLTLKGSIMRTTLLSGLRPWAAAGLLLASLAAVAPAQAGGVSVGVNVGVPVGYGYGYGGPVGAVGVRYGYGGPHRGYYRGGGWGWGWGLALAAPIIVGSAIIASQPQVVVVETLPAAPPPVAVAAARPDPVIYPRNGQNAQQTEADRQECNRWATTQQAAMADGSVFQRAVAACMDARGYTLR